MNLALTPYPIDWALIGLLIGFVAGFLAAHFDHDRPERRAIARKGHFLVRGGKAPPNPPPGPRAIHNRPRPPARPILLDDALAAAPPPAPLHIRIIDPRRETDLELGVDYPAPYNWQNEPS